MRSALLCLLLTLLAAVCALAAIEQDNPHGPIDLPCSSCHTTQSWGKLLPTMAFDHASTGFALEGQHRSVECADCHSSLVFAEARPECSSCHIDVHENQFGASCDECHSPDRWIDEPAFRLRHQTTRFPLVGVHNSLDCSACHGQGDYVSTPVACQGCHYDQYLDTDNPDHANAGFSEECQLCHSVATPDWTELSVAFEHSPSFPLTGGHAIHDCALCHRPGVLYALTPSECYACHRTDYEAASDPDHLAGNFGTRCEVCHGVTSWEEASFDHEVTGFFLTGGHQLDDCGLCHEQGYVGTDPACIGCHREQATSASEPPHELAAFGEDCALCHSINAWAPSLFNHDTMTDYPLTGQHAPLAQSCGECHPAGAYSSTSSDCSACHQADYEATDDPDHLAQQFPTDCTLCHSTASWEESDFDHDANTAFPLTGAHVTLQCADCHGDGYVNTPTACYACHQADYEATDDPDHLAQQFPTDCRLCHSTASWEESDFDHDANTAFPLTGAHVTLQCADCHGDGYVDTPTACYACHQADYEATDDPDHAANNYSHDCSECHNTVDWDDAEGFDHASNTEFTLDGAHSTPACVACHEAGFSGTSSACQSCHLEQMQAASNPPHDPASFGEDCSVCHATSAWQPASFEHQAVTGYPLAGSHNSLDCGLCHLNGQFENTPRECFFCHEQDYNDANDPNHLAAGFPTNCEECHAVTNWSESTFNHDALHFPIDSGEHAGEWSSCSQCHPSAGSFADFTCLSCHEHNQADMNDEHDDVSGYLYESGACLSCHPDGDSSDDKRRMELLRRPDRNETQ